LALHGGIWRNCIRISALGLSGCRHTDGAPSSARPTSGQRFFLLGDQGKFPGFVGVEFDETFPLGRNPSGGKNGFGRTFGHAGATIDALNGIDDQHGIVFVKTVHRTHRNARGIFAVDAGLCNDMSHVKNIISISG